MSYYSALEGVSLPADIPAPYSFGLIQHTLWCGIIVIHTDATGMALRLASPCNGFFKLIKHIFLHGLV